MAVLLVTAGHVKKESEGSPKQTDVPRNKIKIVPGPEGPRKTSSVTISLRCRFAIYRSSLVDPASSHMLVSKIKPCMSQCKPK